MLLGNSVGCHSNKYQKTRAGGRFFRFFHFPEHSVLWNQIAAAVHPTQGEEVNEYNSYLLLPQSESKVLSLSPSLKSKL